jgi:hypothetical protein
VADAVLSPSRTCIRQGDRLPQLELVPGFECGPAWDPAAYSGYTVYLFGPLNLSGALVYDADLRALVYAWPASSTDVPGAYGAIVQATEIASGLTITWPCTGYAEVEIVPWPG